MDIKFLNFKNEVLAFNIVPLHFIDRDITSVFYRKNNKTLKETLNSKKYINLKYKFENKYKNYMNMPLGDFMKLLKESNDKNYKDFLNRNGDKKYCKFKINSYLNNKGVYCFFEENEIKYIGKCTTDFDTRINNGYGRISPKNCFKDGRSTNCHINSLINLSLKITFAVHLMDDKSDQEIDDMEKWLLASGN